jgi:hypothetical protein
MHVYVLFLMCPTRTTKDYAKHAVHCPERLTTRSVHPDRGLLSVTDANPTTPYHFSLISPVNSFAPQKMMDTVG